MSLSAVQTFKYIHRKWNLNTKFSIYICRNKLCYARLFCSKRQGRLTTVEFNTQNFQSKLNKNATN